MKKLLFGVPIIFAILGAVWGIISVFVDIMCVGHCSSRPWGIPSIISWMYLDLRGWMLVISSIIIGIIITLSIGLILTLGLIVVAGGKKSGR